MQHNFYYPSFDQTQFIHFVKNITIMGGMLLLASDRINIVMKKKKQISKTKKE